MGEFDEPEFIQETRIAPASLQTKGRLFVALGYPNSRNKKFNSQARTAKSQLYSYAATVKPSPDLADELGLSGEEHLFLDFNSKHSFDEAGNKASSVDPTGMSGGPLIDAGNLGDPERYKPNVERNARVAGILIENHRSHNAICAIRMARVVAEIVRLDV